MRHLLKYCSLLLVFLLLVTCAACDGRNTDEEGPGSVDPVDYASELKLDTTSSTLKQEVTVKTYVDGDTTHFHVPSSLIGNEVFKARYLAVNTPESTGKIEEWGKKASAFTREKLSTAASILIESDDDTWNADSTGGRYLVWVWYKPTPDADYRNLNLELLQNGLCIASSTANNRYGETCMAALNQAKTQKLHIYSSQKDPEFYYGDAIELSLVELRTNMEAYTNQKVAFEGVITLNDGNSIYMEEYDPDTGLYYGISVYYGYGLSGGGLEILSVGNRSRIVGTVQYYEAGGTYQVSGLQYRQMKPDDPSNIQKISEGHVPSYVKTDPETFASGEISIERDGVVKTFDHAYIAMNTSVSMEGLKVTDIYTTNDPNSSSNGAMTLTCKAGDTTITVRTAVLRDDGGNLVTADTYEGKTIDVRGIVDFFDGHYQIKILSYHDIFIQN